MTEQTPSPPEPAAPADESLPVDQQAGMSQWQFLHEHPTREQVMALLQTLPPRFGVHVKDFADYVQALPQSIKVERPNPSGRGAKITDHVPAWTVYMSVAGRLAMAAAIEEENGLVFDYEPEEVTPTGVPGLIQHGDGRIVYREYAVLRSYTEGHRDDEMGRKPGMAWVPYSGGKQAAGSNPYEKVETAARGRALGAWGIGVLPGSGVATVEEMASISGNAAAMQADDQGQPAGGVKPRKTREEIIEMAMTLQEELRQERGIDSDEMMDKTGAYLAGLGIVSVYNAEDHEIDWAKVKDGQVSLLVNNLRDALQQVRNERSAL